ncbi:fibropellin-3-like [Ptychodera flava]|uniref:fibropellin-3-like n=1 Tax=Ptychodera flava TaxID=63121 RepID=UPI00396AAADA
MAIEYICFPIDVDDCQPNPCQNDFDDCQPSPCQNGGECQDGVDSYSCQCLQGYTGSDCEIDVDECQPNPCQNGGLCQDGVDSYTCQCLQVFTGSDYVDDCQPNPCKNGGQCQDGVDSYTCRCLQGYTGSDCEIDVDDCQPNPCQYGGECQDGVDSYTCQCLQGFTGFDCEIDLDDCQPNPCQNGGQCQVRVDSYTCQCLRGFTGSDCEIPLSPSCSTDNGGCSQICNQDSIRQHHCACEEGYTLNEDGKTCDLFCRIDETQTSTSVVIDCVRYALYDNTLRKSWDEARNDCQSIGGTLAKIRGQDETDCLLNWMAAYYPSIGGVWIGLRASDDNPTDPDEYIWEADGTTVAESGFSNWNTGEPDFRGHRCVRMRARFNFMWGDDLCSRTRNYLCEIDDC